jgi:phage terminase large subunit-like protein
MNLLEAIGDQNLFKRWLGDPSWAPWRAFLGALFGLPMDAEQRAVFKQCTGRTTAPTAAFNEAWLVCGRRGGKSSVLALVAVYLAAFRDYREHLAPGEVATIRIMAADRAQARTIFRYVGALLRETPLLERLIERELAESFELSNRVVIEIGTASFKSVRGYSFAGVLCDEIAFWQ